MSETQSTSGLSLRSVGKHPSMSTIESSVTRLLVSTKHLLESLTQWARQEADDKFVSDAYVKLGNDFRAATRAFTNAGVDISDIGDVPKALRIVLESALSESPTQENLDRFLPNIRSIIVNLLQNLKAKQLRAKELSYDKTRKEPDAPQPRTPSSIGMQPARNSVERSLLFPRKSKLLTENLIRAQQLEPESAAQSENNRQEKTNSHDSVTPKKGLASSEALAQLQKGNVILRRASKRFSAYQFAKLTNFSNNQLPRLAGDPDSTPKTPDTSIEFKEPVEPVTQSNLNGKNSSGKIGLFLRINERTKKVDIELPVTLASLRLLFVEKFAYSPGISSFPEIYVLDPITKFAFELEEHLLESEMKNGVLVFLKEQDPQVQTMKEIEEKVQNLDSRFDGLAESIVSEIRSAIGSIELKAPVLETITKEVAPETASPSSRDLERVKMMNELQQELKVIRQILNTNKTNTNALIQEILAQTDSLKEVGFEDSSHSTNRSYMERSYLKLSDESDTLLTKVDDLQDMMEALRKDVAQRGVRVDAKQLKSTYKEIEEAKHLLRSLIDYISDGKLTWKKIWEAELDKVCEEQQFFNLQDDLTLDLDEDIKKIEETFDLIEKCSMEQSKQGSSKRNKIAARMPLPEPGTSMHNIKDAILNEVASLIPDHESRLEAIAKAEKIRQRERDLAPLDQFQEELGDFVDDNRLKKSGGIEELERLRQIKDSENLRSGLGIV